MQVPRDQARSPSPNQYSPRPQRGNSPTFSMRSRTAVPHPSQNVPGPQYNLPSTIFKSNQILLKSRSPQKYANNLPGPADYTLPVRPSSPQITCGARTFINNTQQVPAPNTYNISNQFSPKITLKSRVPEYTARINTEFTTTPQRPKTQLGISLASRTKTAKTDMNQPGPDRYTPGEKYFRSDITIHSKIEDKVEANGVGPGQYTINHKLTEKAAPMIKMGARSPLKQVKALSDAFYEIPSSFSHKGASFKGRNEPLVRAASPGPASYDTRGKNSEAKIQLGGRTRVPGSLEYQIMKNEQPAPNTYSLDMHNSQKLNITLKSRIQEVSTLDVPGPGSYNTIQEFKQLHEHNVPIKMGNKYRHKEKTEPNLSPFSYKIKDRLETEGKTTMGARTYGQIMGLM
ncbi:SHIPPO_1-like protein [Hexamita inflata]|uniref:SHIPPO 1-like protein n=1 Tax=Hexamita inflata TaxID=28002 RepID=A0AA86VEV1_9EUKA|nr:SHIPPO 1-like protein [Hexamita inflata]